MIISEDGLIKTPIFIKFNNKKFLKKCDKKFYESNCI